MASYHVSRVVSVRLPAKQICQWGSARARFPMKLLYKQRQVGVRNGAYGKRRLCPPLLSCLLLSRLGGRWRSLGECSNIRQKRIHTANRELYVRLVIGL